MPFNPTTIPIGRPRKGRPRIATEVKAVVLTSDVAQRLRDRAAERGTSVSQEIREAIEKLEF